MSKNSGLALLSALLSFTLLDSVAYGQAVGGVTTSSPSVFGSFSGQSDTLNTLTCGLSSSALLGINHVGNFNSTGWTLQLGLDANFGGIGTSISLTNPSNNTTINVVEDRSGAGAGWQNSYFVYDKPSDQLIVFNQGAGNAIGTQWGYSNVSNKLTQAGWNPMWADHSNPHYSTAGVSQIAPFSPCNSTGYSFDNAHSSIVANPLETPYGNVIHFTNTFQIKSAVNQYWSFRTAEQALYLSKSVARANNLRRYLRGASGWIEGPIDLTGQFSVLHGTSSCTSTSCDAEVNTDLDYIMLVWNVGGADIAVAIRASGFGADITNTKNTYCSDTTNYSCGSIAVHTWMSNQQNIGIPVGEIDTYKTEYYAGLPTQLAALGLNTTGGTISGYSGISSSCVTTNAASSSNQLSSQPASNLVAMTNFYSSNSFSSNIATNGTYAATYFSNSFGHIRLSPRIKSGSPLAFPATYQLYLSTSDGQHLVDIGFHNQQPDASGVVDVPLGYRLAASAIADYPYVVATDDYGNYYFQLVGLQGCN